MDILALAAPLAPTVAPKESVIKEWLETVAERGSASATTGGPAMAGETATRAIADFTALHALLARTVVPTVPAMMVLRETRADQGPAFAMPDGQASEEPSAMFVTKASMVPPAPLARTVAREFAMKALLVT